MSIIYCNVYAHVKPEEENHALQTGWAVDEWADEEPRCWFQGRQVRLNVNDLVENKKTRKIVRQRITHCGQMLRYIKNRDPPFQIYFQSPLFNFDILSRFGKKL